MGIRVPPDSSGKVVETNTPNTDQRQVVSVGSAGDANIADVTSGKALKVDASATTQPVSGTVSINAIPAGTAVIGHVIVDTAPTTAVTGTFWQATQPVSGTFWQATQPVSGTFWQATQPVSIASMPSTPVTGTFWQATQPVSAATLPLPSGAATDASLTTIDTDLKASQPRTVQGSIADGSPVTTNPVLIGGVDQSGNAETFDCLNGALLTQENQGSPILETLQGILLELRTLRIATVGIAVADGVRISERDFDPVLITDSIN